MIGDKIYKLRKERGLSQEELASSIGVTRQIISKWESNTVMPGMDKIKSICEIYNLSYDQFMGRNIKKNIIKYIILFIIMAIIEIIIIFIYSNIDKKREYKCLGNVSYLVQTISSSSNTNYDYVTFKSSNNIETVLVSKVITSYLEEGNYYTFTFNSYNDNNNIKHIFQDNEIINIKKTSEEYIEDINCK